MLRSLLVSLALFAVSFPALPLVPSAASEMEVADRARTKVVVLKTVRPTGRGAATGFLARPGVVVTAGHAVAEASAITAWINGVAYRARVLATHPEFDLAALAIESPELLLKPVELARESTALEPGEALVVLAGPSQPAGATGEPAERIPRPAVYRQRVLVKDTHGRLREALKMETSVVRGDSGSPVLRVRDGTVVGVLSSRELPDANGVSRSAFAVPVEAIHRWLGAAAPPRPVQAEEGFYLQRVAGD